MNTIGFSLGIALLALGAAVPPQGGSAGILEDILLAEDRRARGAGDLALLTGALGHPDTLVVRRAARALGRLERPALATHLFPLLVSPFPEVRSTAAEAIAQAAQGFRGDSTSDARGNTWPLLLAALRERLPEESDPGVRGMLALSLGRLPYYDPGEVAAVRRALIDLCSGVRGGGEANTRFCRGAETLVRTSWRRASLEPDERRGLGDAVRRGRAAAPRRHALGALIASQALDDSVLALVLQDRDPEVRRLGLTGMRRPDGDPPEHPLLLRALADSVPAVRLEALRALSRVAAERSCPRLVRASEDPAPMVALMAIDLLGGCGRHETAVLRLTSLAGRLHPPSASPPARPSTWHAPAHALVAIARADSARAALLIPEAAAHRIWEIRMYAARAAALVRDSASLLLLGEDLVPNVREAAIAGLAAVLGHRADAVYRQALRSNDYQVVRTAARVLAGTPARAAAAPALLEALDRMSRAMAMTARDTRVEILNRLRETGYAILVPRLAPYLRDYDPVIADSVSAVMHAWSGEHRAPAPITQEDLEPVRLSEVVALRGARLVVQMEGGTFEIALLTEEAPVTVARVARLARSRYFTDLTFHRVAPNFVAQGGSPGANEYSGTPAYMRDELSSVSHARGTLGISTRGRDTGDGQLFINLRDNPRLDYDYTVWGRVVSGMGVVDAMQEGARIRGISIRLAR